MSTQSPHCLQLPASRRRPPTDQPHSPTSTTDARSTLCLCNRNPAFPSAPSHPRTNRSTLEDAQHGCPTGTPVRTARPQATARSPASSNLPTRETNTPINAPISCAALSTPRRSSPRPPRTETPPERHDRTARGNRDPHATPTRNSLTATRDPVGHPHAAQRPTHAARCDPTPKPTRARDPPTGPARQPHNLQTTYWLIISTSTGYVSVPLVGAPRTRALPQRQNSDDHCRLRRLEQPPRQAVEDRAAAPRRRHRLDARGLPLPARHIEVEQGRAPAIQLHQPQLARQATHQLPGRDRAHSRDHHEHRPERLRQARRHRLPPKDQNHRPADRRRQHHRAPVPSRVELQHQPITH